MKKSNGSMVDSIHLISFNGGWSLQGKFGILRFSALVENMLTLGAKLLSISGTSGLAVSGFDAGSILLWSVILFSSSSQSSTSFGLSSCCSKEFTGFIGGSERLIFSSTIFDSFNFTPSRMGRIFAALGTFISSSFAGPFSVGSTIF